MSIKKSLRTSILLLTAIPVILISILAYFIVIHKYEAIAKQSLLHTTQNYCEGFEAQLNSQIIEATAISNMNDIKSLLIEKVKHSNINLNSSQYYKTVTNNLEQISDNFNGMISYSLYDIDGYYITGSGNSFTGDWAEYMKTPVIEITSQEILTDCNLGDSDCCIDIITPVIVKQQTVGLVRASIPAEYFSSFISSNKNTYLLDANGNFIFETIGSTEEVAFLADAAKKYLADADTDSNNTFYKNNSTLDLYGYSTLANQNWIYIMKQDNVAYNSMLASVSPVLLTGLILFLIIALLVSRVLAKKYTDPILELNSNMEAVSNGNYDVVCKIKSNDEFGQLSNRFNHMMAIISETRKKLLDTQKSLEENNGQLLKLNQDIGEIAYTDGLTKLFNRVAFFKYAKDILNSPSGTFNKHAILFIDLDNFKNVNDTLGHDYGDELLIQIAQKLSSYVAPDDILARTGGDEFLIFKNRAENKEELNQFAADLIDIANHPFFINDETVHVSMSIGVSLFPQNGLSLNELIKNADIAMYSAKNAGKNSYMFFNSRMEDEVTRRNELIGILREAIDNKDIYLVYQPQASVTTGEITGYEALMRLNSKVIGRVSPDEFIPIAEECGLIEELGDWALFEACTFNKKLLDLGYENIRVSVNISTNQLRGTHLIETLNQVYEKVGMPLSYLEIEITESVLMDSFEHNLEIINQIKALGARISLDDFGTGYSSFNYLTQLPINTLKIDKTFITGICDNEKDKYIADAIIALAHKMDITVIAEGVEDIDQLTILREQMCDTLQGYYFSKPISSEEFIKLLEEKKKENK